MTITENLKIDIDFSGYEVEKSDPQGIAAEMVTLGNITITGGDNNEINLTKSIAGKNMLSGFCMAQWLAGSYWRLCYETFTPDRDTWLEQFPASDFYMAHNFTAIGHGYIWPDITATTNGNIVTLKSTAFEKPYEHVESPIQYTSNDSISVPLKTFQKAVLEFIHKVIKYTKENAPHVVFDDNDYIMSDEEIRKLSGVHYEKDSADEEKKYRIMAMLGLYESEDTFLSYMVRQPKRDDGLKFSFEQQGLIIRNCGIPDTYFIMRSVTQIREPVLNKAINILKNRFGEGCYGESDFFYMERVSKNGNKGDIFRDCPIDACEALTSFLYEVSSATDTIIMIDNMMDSEIRKIGNM